MVRFSGQRRIIVFLGAAVIGLSFCANPVFGDLVYQGESTVEAVHPVIEGWEAARWTPHVEQAGSVQHPLSRQGMIKLREPAVSIALVVSGLVGWVAFRFRRRRI